MAHASATRLIWDCGWVIAILVLLLQAITYYLPAGEGRDWVYYYAVGGWAGLAVASAFFERDRFLSLKKALTAYAVCALSYYFLLPLLTLWLIWLWALAAVTALAWVKYGVKQDWRARVMWGAGLWLLMVAFAMCGSLVYSSPWYDLTRDGGKVVEYALSFAAFVLFTCPWVYVALRRTGSGDTINPLATTLVASLHIITLYVLVALLFRVDRLETTYAVHHWRAYLEPAAMLRDGGWLLWDVPNVYGFLQTLVMAMMPTASTWQSLYLLNGSLLVMSGYAIFYVFFTGFRTFAGAIAAMLLALSCTLMLFPTTGDPRLFPNTGALRFFWVYPMVAYVFWLCHLPAAMPRVSRCAAITCGHLIWLAGVLWSPESAAFVSVIWLPSLVLMGAAPVLQQLPLKEVVLRAGIGLIWPVLWLAGTCAAIAWFYHEKLGHWPDTDLLTAYTRAFAFSYATIPIIHFGALPCWLFVLAMMVLLCRQYVLHTSLDTRSILNLTVFYALAVALWAVSSYYIPYSEDLHLTGTLPVMTFLAGLLLWHARTLTLLPVAQAAYEKGIICLCSVLLLGSLVHIVPRHFESVNIAAPVHTDITEILEEPPAELRQLVDRAQMPPGAHVMVLSQPFVMDDYGNHVLSLMEGVYFKDIKIKSWMLPNTVLGYDRPLLPGQYMMLAERRIERLGDNEGWLIEWLDNPLYNYPWVQGAIMRHYSQIGMYENSKFRLRHYEKRSAAH